MYCQRNNRITIKQKLQSVIGLDDRFRSLPTELFYSIIQTVWEEYMF